MTVDSDPLGLERWASMDLAARRQELARALRGQLEDLAFVLDVVIEVGPIGREYDLTAAVDTDVGRLRTPLWSHARAMIYEDESVHPENRRQIGPHRAIAEAADRLRRRLAVPYSLESRGLTASYPPEEGVVRTWTAEHSRFRKRTAVVREDAVERAGDLDVRDLLAHFYTGPSLRLVSASNDPFLLPGAAEAEGPLVTLCHDCHAWAEGSHATCPGCTSERVDVVLAATPPRR